MGQLFEYIKIALNHLRASKGRAFLTMLGIIIGIASVITVITVGNGLSGSVSGELDSFGNGMIQIYANVQGKGVNVSFDSDDIDYLKQKLEHVKGITPATSWTGKGKGPKGEFDATVTAGNSALQYYSTEPLIRGHYFTEEDSESGAHVCVLTRASAMALFGSDDVIGMTFELNLYGTTTELKIVGIRQDKQAKIISMLNGGDDSLSIEMPYSVLTSLFGMDEGYDVVVIFPESSVYANETATRAVKLLNAKKGVQDPNIIQVQSMTDFTSQVDNVMQYITVFVSLVAAISLLVGGIGVMNIMLVSVTERTREIGIRKSLGARTSSIMMQFLAEAGIITLLGGLIGIVLGLVIGNVVCSVLSFPASISPFVVIAATLFSSAVGIFFGIYPAKKAAKLSPIEALRHE